MLYDGAREKLSKYAILWITEPRSIFPARALSEVISACREAKEERKFFSEVLENLLKRLQSSDIRSHSPKAKASPIKSHGFLRGLRQACFTASNKESSLRIFNDPLRVSSRFLFGAAERPKRGDTR
jgi:hypothetical protein